MKINKYFIFFRLSFRNIFEYKSDFILMGVGSLFLFLVQYYLLRFVFENQNEINGLSLQNAITYIVLSMALSNIHGHNVDRSICLQVKHGSISFFLLKPINFILLNSFKSLGIIFAKTLISTIPITVISFVIFKIPLPNPGNLAFFLVVFSLDSLLITSLYLLVGLIAFYTVDSTSFGLVLQFVRHVFSGALLPLAFLPSFVQRISTILPFHYLIDFPIRIWLGKLPVNLIISGSSKLILWIIGCFALCLIVYTKGVKKLVVVGA